MTLAIALGPYSYRSSPDTSLSPNPSLDTSTGTTAGTSLNTSLGASLSPSPGLVASGVLELSFLYSAPLDLALVPVLTALTPSAAVAGGPGLAAETAQGPGLGVKGTVVATGTGFLSSSLDASNDSIPPIPSTCWFGHLSVPALITSSTQLSCPCPVAVRPGTVDFTVVVGGVRSQSGVLNFTYLAPVLVRAVWPLSGSVAGGTPVVVYGWGFLTASEAGGGASVSGSSGSDNNITNSTNSNISTITNIGDTTGISTTVYCLFHTISSLSPALAVPPARTLARVLNNTAIQCDTPPR